MDKLMDIDKQKKAAIVTIWDEKNYGNRLQNYATQAILASLGLTAVTIRNIPPQKKSRGKKIPFDFPKRILMKILNRRVFKERNQIVNKRKESFKAWNNQYISFTPFLVQEGNIPLNLSQKYEYFFVGSDQVWNPIFRRCFSLDFLTFAPKNKRIAYAASFGIPKLPESEHELYRSHLEEFHAISVREESGAALVFQLIGREVPVLIDPTLMLKEEDWRRIAKIPNTLKKPCIVTYFLGNSDGVIESFLSNHTELESYERIDLNSYADQTRFAIDPSEFLGYLCSADMIMTDSFHGVIFSIIFKKPFVVFERLSNGFSMNTRIESLLKMFALEDRYISNYEMREIGLQDIDFSHVEAVIEKERTKSIEYLRNSMLGN